VDQERTQFLEAEKYWEISQVGVFPGRLKAGCPPFNAVLRLEI
jgi:hypothetical protein